MNKSQKLLQNKNKPNLKPKMFTPLARWNVHLWKNIHTFGEQIFTNTNFEALSHSKIKHNDRHSEAF